MITKPEHANPRSARIDAPDGFGTDGAKCFTAKETAEIATSYGLALLKAAETPGENTYAAWITKFLGWSGEK